MITFITIIGGAILFVAGYCVAESKYKKLMDLKDARWNEILAEKIHERSK